MQPGQNTDPVFVVTEEATKESGWPSKGVIEFQRVSLSYDIKQEPVVTDVSFKINSGERVRLM